MLTHFLSLINQSLVATVEEIFILNVSYRWFLYLWHNSGDDDIKTWMKLGECPLKAPRNQKHRLQLSLFALNKAASLWTNKHVFYLGIRNQSVEKKKIPIWILCNTWRMWFHAWYYAAWHLHHNLWRLASCWDLLSHGDSFSLHHQKMIEKKYCRLVWLYYRSCIIMSTRWHKQWHNNEFV